MTGQGSVDSRLREKMKKTNTDPNSHQRKNTAKLLRGAPPLLYPRDPQSWRRCRRRLVGVLTKLKTLYLGGTQVTDAGCAALAAALDGGALPVVCLNDLISMTSPASEAARAALMARFPTTPQTPTPSDSDLDDSDDSDEE